MLPWFVKLFTSAVSDVSPASPKCLPKIPATYNLLYVGALDVVPILIVPKFSSFVASLVYAAPAIPPIAYVAFEPNSDVILTALNTVFKSPNESSI